MSIDKHSLKVGDIVQSRYGKYRQGVIYKKKKDTNVNAIVPWAYFEVLWATGERSTERADTITHASDLKDQFNDLILLRDLQESVKSGASYD